MELKSGLIQGIKQFDCPHQDDRPDEEDVSLLVIHNITLPPGKFNAEQNGGYITDLFMGQLDTNHHPYFQQIAGLRVSAHCLITRSGEVIQYVPFHKRAWHAGVSSFQGRDRCNDYGIGIELEGTDDIGFTDIQYQRLIAITATIMKTYPKVTLGRIVGHNDIAPGRKTDPGQAFDWARFRTSLCKETT